MKTDVSTVVSENTTLSTKCHDRRHQSRSTLGCQKKKICCIRAAVHYQVSSSYKVMVLQPAAVSVSFQGCLPGAQDAEREGRISSFGSHKFYSTGAHLLDELLRDVQAPS